MLSARDDFSNTIRSKYYRKGQVAGMANQYRDQEMYRTAAEQSIYIYENYLYELERHPNTVRKYVHDVRDFFRFVQIRMKAENRDSAELPDKARTDIDRGRQGPDRAKAEGGDDIGAQERERVCAEDGKEEGRGKIRSGDDSPGDRILKREWVLCYKEYLIERYKVTSTNSMLAALNGYLKFIGREDCCVKLCRVQRQIFREEDKELSQEEYRRLVIRAKQDGNPRLGCILQTIGSTGIRVGELPYITVEALDKMIVCIRSKGKERCIVLPQSLVKLLREYCVQEKIQTGSIFITRSGRPVDRRNIWAEMKKLCQMAGVMEKKGFPHNLRHLFARTYYEKEKDIVRLADYLGHSNVETTRRYTMVSSMRACLRQLELGMLVEGYLPDRRIRQKRVEEYIREEEERDEGR